MGTNRKKKALKYGFTETTIVEGWANKYESLKVYLDTLNSRQGSAAMSVYHFCKYADLDPDQLVALKSDRNKLDAERLLIHLKKAKVDFPEGRKWHVAMCVRGFFRTNLCHLEPEAGRIEYNPQKIKKLTPKESRLALFKVARSNLRDQALIMVGTCSAMALETLSEVCRCHMEKGWEKQDIPMFDLPSEIIKGHGKGKYRGVKQVTFITPEAKKVLTDYFDWMEKHFNHKWSDDDHIFLSIKRNIGAPLTYRQVAKRCTKLEEDSGVNFTFHDGRGILNTALQNVSCDPNWIQIAMGRKVPGNKDPYTLPTIEKLRAKYREALPDLEFLSESTPNNKKLGELEKKVEDKERVVQALIESGNKKEVEFEKLKLQVEELRKEGLTPEKLEKLDKLFDLIENDEVEIKRKPKVKP